MAAAHADNDSNNYDYLIKLLALGESSVGKTSILYHYTDGKFSDKFVSTVGVDFKQKHILHQSKDENGLLGKEQRILLQLWDTAGQERFRSLSTAFFRDAMGFMLVFDLTNENTLIQMRHWIQLLRDNAYTENPDMILIGNKLDLADAHRAVPREAAEQLADELGIKYIETSALTGESITDAVDILVELVMQRIEKSVDKSGLAAKRGPTKKLKKRKKKNPEENGGGCC